MSVDGGEEKPLPVTVELPPGAHVFEAWFENWPQQKREVAVSAGERVELGFTFDPVTVELTSVPAGAEVRERGTGRVLGTTPLTLGDLTPGPVNWEVVLAGHEPAKWERELNPGMNGPERVALRALMEGAQAGEVRTFGGIEMVWCPPGEFWMGSPEAESGRDDDETQHRVTLKQGFWLAKTECTQAQWERVISGNPSQFRGIDLPVEQVNSENVQGWLQRMNEKNPVTSGWKWDLPTEAQWEYACRAGTQTPFHFGNVLNGNEANCDGNYPYGTYSTGPYQARTVTVAQYAPNPWGLHDMHGNVWEWCNDEYGEYERNQVVRGGSWYGTSMLCRSANRHRESRDYRHPTIGFRPALVAIDD